MCRNVSWQFTPYAGLIKHRVYAVQLYCHFDQEHQSMKTLLHFSRLCASNRRAAMNSSGKWSYHPITLAKWHRKWIFYYMISKVISRNWSKIKLTNLIATLVIYSDVRYSNAYPLDNLTTWHSKAAFTKIILSPQWIFVKCVIHMDHFSATFIPIWKFWSHVTWAK